MKIKWIRTAVLLALLMVLVPLAPGSAVAQEQTIVPVEEATLAAQAHIDTEVRKGTLPAWRDATPTEPVTYYDPDGSIAVHVFSVTREQEDVGFVTLSAYKRPVVLEFSTAPAPHKLILDAALTAAQQTSLQLDMVHPVFLGPPWYVYQSTGTSKGELVFVALDGARILHLSTDEVAEMTQVWRHFVDSQIAQPLQAAGSIVAQGSKVLSVAPVRQGCSTLQPCNCAACGGMCGDPYCGTSNRCFVGCHPAAGSPIMKYWNGHGYPGLGSNTDTIMVNLHHYMNTTECGVTTRPNSTAGIESYTASRGYAFDTTCYSTHSGCSGQPPSFQQLVTEVDAGRPPIVAFNGHAYTGIGYDTNGQTAILNSNLGNDPRYVSWSLIASYTGNAAAGIITIHSLDSKQPPTADAGGPYTANEGQTVILDASGSSDSDGTIVSFEWDLDGDGEYDDATGQTPSWTWGDDYADSIGLKVTDDDGDIDTDTTMVTISNVAPTVDAGPDQSVFRNDVVALSGAWTDPAGSLDELYSWTWDVTGDGITDNSGSASYGSVVPASTSFATEGIYTLTFSVTDKDGGAGSDSTVVEVLNRPPDCSVAAASIETIWPPNHKLVLVNVLGVTDPEGDPVSITIDRIRQDEPVDTVGKGRSSPDGQGVGTDTAHVRAERMGTKKAPGNGRVYHISFTADDGHGGSCSSEVLVGVPHDRRGTPPVDDGALYDSTALAP